MFEPLEWFDTAEAAETLSFFPELTPTGAYRVASTLGGVEKLGMIPDTTLAIFEFGSAMGEGLITLDMFAKHAGGAVVTGSEVDPYTRRIARQVSDLLTSVVGVDENGHSSLEDADESFDIIIANMFGPSYYEDCTPSTFIPRALDALTKVGVIILNSDDMTMRNINVWAQHNLQPSQIEIVDTDTALAAEFKVSLPHTLITKA